MPAQSRLALLAAAVAGLFASAWGIQSEAAIMHRQRIHGQPGSVHLDVFYESMCPYCHKFFNETLRFFWQDDEIRPLVDLDLHPAGNLQAIPMASVSKGYLFWHPEKTNHSYVYLCQHGESECLGNLIHMCAKKVLVDPDKYMPLYFCMAAQPESVPEKSSYGCMEELSIEPEPIRDCVQSPTANEEMFAVIQADVGLDPPRKYVPWVVLNGKHLEIQDGKADLRTAICSALGENAPESCSQSLSAKVTQFMQQQVADGPASPGPCYWNATSRAF
mmetsp:Transcript_31297/g.89815  ORF Transcript_31297/g.89815 Transcript_31297/m.89815 type:complete len:275 (-) Transcript_31297:118-942(-)